MRFWVVGFEVVKRLLAGRVECCCSWSILIIADDVIVSLA